MSDGADLEALFATYRELSAELREQVRDAHGAAKDLRAAIREARSMITEMADACAKAAHEASSAEMASWAAHVQREMNARAKDLNRAVTAARDHIGRQLMPKIAAVEIPPGEGEPARLMVSFEGALFDADVPVPADLPPLEVAGLLPPVPDVPAGLRRRQR